MANFVLDNTPLPPLKSDANPPVRPEIEVDAADINGLWAALGDVRTALATEQPVNFIAPFTGAQSRTIPSKLADIVSVKDFGAKGDGVTDDTAAIQAAIAAAGGVFANVLLPCPGTYHTTTMGDLPCSSRSDLRRGSDTGVFLLRLVDNNTINGQIISLNVESEFNPTGTSSWFNFGGTFEAFDPTANAQNFTGQNYGLYGSYSHFGSGSLASGFGVAGEAFNPGSNIATLVVGVSGHAHNGGVAAGSPVQTPANTGAATNLRGVSGVASNESSGVVSQASALYANNATNTGGGSITNCYGLNVAAISGGTNNWAIFTAGGLVEHTGNMFGHGQMSLGQQAPDTAESLWIQPNGSLTGTTQYGARIIPKTSSVATATGIGIQARADTAAAAFTQALNIGVSVATPTVGAGSTITEWEGVRVDPGPTAGTKYAIRTMGASDSVKFAGPVSADTSLNTPRLITPMSSDRGDASVTLAVGTDSQTQRFATALSANRAVTLSTTGAVNGDYFRVVRTGLGAFTLDVGGLKTIPSATAAFVEVMYDGAAWRLIGYGTL